MVDTLDLTEDITFSDEWPIGHGGYSDVYLGEVIKRRLSGVMVKTLLHLIAGRLLKVAIKAFRAFSNHQTDWERASKRLNREMYVWRRLRHPNIAEFFGVALQFDVRPCIVMKWYKNGTAREYLKTHPEYRMVMVRDIALGLVYLHTLQPPIVHGDLKGCNALVTDDGRAVLSDFGLSKVIDELAEPTGLTTSGHGGNVRWMAPELLFDQAEEEGFEGTYASLTQKSDVWSFGCVAYELLTDTDPYPDDRHDWHVNHSIISHLLPSSRKPAGPDQWLKACPELYGILRDCWSFDPCKRPHMQAVCDRLFKAKDVR